MTPIHQNRALSLARRAPRRKRRRGHGPSHDPSRRIANERVGPGHTPVTGVIGKSRAHAPVIVAKSRALARATVRGTALARGIVRVARAPGIAVVIETGNVTETETVTGTGTGTAVRARSAATTYVANARGRLVASLTVTARSSSTGRARRGGRAAARCAATSKTGAAREAALAVLCTTKPADRAHALVGVIATETVIVTVTVTAIAIVTAIVTGTETAAEVEDAGDQ